MFVLHRFGGDPEKITIMGQSGGGYAIASQLALYDGEKPNFKQAVARSIQRSPMFTVEQHSVRAPSISPQRSAMLILAIWTLTGTQCPPSRATQLRLGCLPD
jgi:carboxylesterase type B